MFTAAEVLAMAEQYYWPFIRMTALFLAAPIFGASSFPVRARILLAAEERFVRYGFGKTTMAEIAADCGMSAGNLYRFFDNKGDIATASASQWLAALEARLSTIGDDAQVSPADRLSRTERFISKWVGATSGDYREWDEIEAWTKAIADELVPPSDRVIDGIGRDHR